MLPLPGTVCIHLWSLELTPMRVLVEPQQGDIWHPIEVTAPLQIHRLWWVCRGGCSPHVGTTCPGLTRGAQPRILLRCNGSCFCFYFWVCSTVFPGAAVSIPLLGWMFRIEDLDCLMFSKAGKAASVKWHSGSRWRMVLISRVSIRGNYTLIDPFGIKMSPNTCSHIGKWRSYFYSSTQVCVLWEIISSKLSGWKEPDGWYI